ncbi:hypothetical protein V6N12_007997 [Hibiscus sabdariffa]|uniref:Uncharacterized protein n=1 Tax=Hibiscus sabdariffa TaxID=183260 RepID=A0ABR2BSL7_9ROSI
MTTPYQTATFKQPSATENGPYDYTRSGNPRRDTLESFLRFCKFVISVKGDDIYGGPDRLLSCVTPKSGVLVRQVNTSDLDEVDKACGVGESYQPSTTNC